MLILGLDLETTHYDIDILRVTEIGAVLYDTENWAPIEIQADIVKEDDIKLPMDPFIVDLTGITDNMVETYGRPSIVALENFMKLYDRADYVCGHNGLKFDKPVMVEWAKRYGFDYPDDKPWLDTMTDAPYPQKINTRKLEDLTGRHGFLNPFPHRAFSDVLSMMKILSMYDLDQVIKISESPVLTFYALVSFHDRQLAKDAGFRWNNEIKIGSKSGTWTKEIKEYYVDAEQRTAGTLWDFSYKEEEC